MTTRMPAGTPAWRKAFKSASDLAARTAQIYGPMAVFRIGPEDWLATEPETVALYRPQGALRRKQN